MKKIVQVSLWLSFINLFSCNSYVDTEKNNKIKWVLKGSPLSSIQDSISYIDDSNKCHGVKISLIQIKFTKGSSIRIESMKTIQEYYNGKMDGKYLAFDSDNNLIAVEDIESKVITGSYITKGYKFKFYQNGNVESLDTIIDFYKQKKDPWLLDSTGKILRQGRYLDTSKLFINIKDKKNYNIYKLKHDILDKKYRYWERNW